MEFTIVVIPYVKEKRLAEVLRAVRKQTVTPDKILVVANGEDIPYVGAGVGPPVPTFVMHRTALASAGYARNQGVTEAQRNFSKILTPADKGYVFFLDADCVPTPKWIEENLRLHNAGADAVSTYERYTSTSKLVEYYFRNNAVPVERMSPMGGAISYEWSIFERVGLFPMQEGALTEDIIFSEACEKAGVVFAYQINAPVLHHHADSISELVRKEARYGKQITNSHYVSGTIKSIAGLWVTAFARTILAVAALCTFAITKLKDKTTPDEDFRTY